MYLVSETRDENLLRAILGHDNTYDEYVVDGAPPLEKWHANPNSIWMVLYKNEDIAGLIQIDRLGNMLGICHINIFKSCRGGNSSEWGNLVRDYIRARHGITSLLAITPYLAAKKYAEKIGFTLKTIIPKSIQKNGEVLDQFLLEL